MAWPKLPVLSTLNALPLLAFLTFSRKSRTREEWSFRHSLWHFFLALDMPFFLVTLGFNFKEIHSSRRLKTS